MCQSNNYTKSSVEQYLRYGRGQSRIVINGQPEQKGTVEKLSSECGTALAAYRYAHIDYIKAIRKVLQIQKDKAQLALEIENELDNIIPRQNGELISIIAILLPFLRRAKTQWATRKVISAGTGILRSLIKISDLYPPIRKLVGQLEQKYTVHAVWRNKMDTRGRRKERLYRQYRNMGCPKDVIQQYVDRDENLI